VKWLVRLFLLVLAIGLVYVTIQYKLYLKTNEEIAEFGAHFVESVYRQIENDTSHYDYDQVDDIDAASMDATSR
jgi:hypothetical protein